MKHTTGHQDCFRQLSQGPGFVGALVVLQGLPLKYEFKVVPQIPTPLKTPPPFSYFETKESSSFSYS
jgi:hypothetical protein